MTGGYYYFGVNTGKSMVDSMNGSNFEEAIETLDSQLERHVHEIEFGSLQLDINDLTGDESERVGKMLVKYKSIREQRDREKRSA